MFTVAFATPLPNTRSVARWIDSFDRPSCREAARAPPLCSLSPDLPDNENLAQILIGLVPQWPDVICPYGRLQCAGTLGGGLSVVAVRGEAAPGLRLPCMQAHLTAPFQPRYSLDQRTAGQYLSRLSTPGDRHMPTQPWSPLDSLAEPEHPEGTKHDSA